MLTISIKQSATGKGQKERATTTTSILTEGQDTSYPSSAMAFIVNRSSGVIVKPSEPTPAGILNLSVFERSPIMRPNVPLIFVFRCGHEPAKVIKEAFSKALVPYYPFAGRLEGSPDGALQVNCTGEGGWFIQASANSSLDSVNCLDNLFISLSDHLLPIPPPESYGIDPLVEIQVTSFKCKGFVLGIKVSHSIVDGHGAAQFTSALAELARGLPHPTIPPVWLREAIPSPPGIVSAFGNPPILAEITNHKLIKASFDISLRKINQLKNEFKDSTGDSCTTFEAVVASLWQQRTIAIDFDKTTKVSLSFVVNIRNIMDPPLPEGYYGICAFPAMITMSSGSLSEASNAEIVKLIRDAKARVPNEYKQWVKNGKLDDGTDPFASMTIQLEYTTLCISALNNLGFQKMDYGHGNLIYILGAAPGMGIVSSAFLVPAPKPNNGVRFLTCCVNATHLPRLVDSYKEGTSSRL